MKFAGVIVDISNKDVDKSYTYIIPDDMRPLIAVGTPVTVPFGKRKISGFVTEITDSTDVAPEKLKPIEAVNTKEASIEYQLIRLAVWMKDTYGCTMNQALRTVLPVKRKVKARTKTEENLPRGNESPKTLNEEQLAAVNGILHEFRHPDRRPAVLFGVTGSGKTEVYMELIRRILTAGRQAILLIPEISLTYQNLSRFTRVFGDQVGVVHSKLSAGEKYECFERARKGEISIMIGPRSALFAPFPDLGIIIVDEEHEGAYISDSVPRYNAVEAAVKRGELAGAGVVLGSATPSVNTFNTAMDRKYSIFLLKHRAASGSTLPHVDIIDMREELKDGNKGMFSRKLEEGIRERLEKKEQIMLFLNRRGYSGSISCRSCGKVIRCPHCDVSMTSHKGNILKCHYCGFTAGMPDRCPSCGSPYIAGFGAGTQKVESLIRKKFPEARVIRMDMDTTARKNAHEKLLRTFGEGKADILIGTQMIVKGHDFPKVTLMGILAADLSLNVSSYTAAERTFQLLTQAAGRAGRAGAAGEVMIQTYSPDHYAVTCAAAQDYISFYKQELAYRKLLSYPPAGAMMNVVALDEQEENAAAGIQSFYDLSVSFLKGEGTIIGPVDAGIAKIKDVYRKQFIVKHPERSRLMELRDRIQALPGCLRQIDIT